MNFTYIYKSKDWNGLVQPPALGCGAGFHELIKESKKVLLQMYEHSYKSSIKRPTLQQKSEQSEYVHESKCKIK